MANFDQLVKSQELIDEDILKFKAKKNNIPDGIEYINIGNEMATLNLNNYSLKVTLEIDNALKDKLTDCKDVNELLYNSQREIKVKKIDIDGQTILPDKIFISPFNEFTSGEMFIKAPNFAGNDFFIFDVILNGVKKKVKFIRQPYDGVDIQRYIGSLNNSMNLIFDKHIDDDGNVYGAEFSPSFLVNNIKEIDDVLELKQYFDAIDTLQVGEVEIGKKVLKEGAFLEMNSFLIFWEKVKKIGEDLNLKFKYSTEITNKEVAIIEEVYDSLIIGKYIKAEPLEFDGEIEIIDEKFLGKKEIIITIGEGYIQILNENLKFYKVLILVGYTLKQKYEKIAYLDMDENSFILCRSFANKKECEEYHKILLKNQNLFNDVIKEFI